jgi:hypothetical protein
MKSCRCGLAEFVTNPNSYDVFELVNGKLEFVKRESVNEKENIFCRKCGKKAKIK